MRAVWLALTVSLALPGAGCLCADTLRPTALKLSQVRVWYLRVDSFSDLAARVAPGWEKHAELQRLDDGHLRARLPGAQADLRERGERTELRLVTTDGRSVGATDISNLIHDVLAQPGVTRLSYEEVHE